MGSSGTSAVYIHVVDDVISKVCDEFIKSGVGESVLLELQALWEPKMLQRGAISGTLERSSLPKHTAGENTPVHDLNVPSEGPFEGYQTPTVDMLFPPTPVHTPFPGMDQSPLPGTAKSPRPGIVRTPLPGTGLTDFSRVNDIRNGVDAKFGRPSPYMQPPSPWMNQRPLGVDVNVAFVEGRDNLDGAQRAMQDFFMMSCGKRKRDEYASQLSLGSYIPQQDGSGDVTIELALPKASQIQNSSTRFNKETETAESLSLKEVNALPFLPQLDGFHDEYDNMFHFQGVAHEDYNTPADHVELRVGTPSVGTPKPVESEAVDGEPPLNEDNDDEEDLDELEQEEEPNTSFSSSQV